MGEAILVEVIRLSGLAGLPVWITLGLVVLSAVLVVVGKRLGGVTLPKGESGPPPANDETPAPGSPLPTDPERPGGEFNHGG
jgi:hypothetical protein